MISYRQAHKTLAALAVAIPTGIATLNNAELSALQQANDKLQAELASQSTERSISRLLQSKRQDLGATHADILAKAFLAASINEGVSVLLLLAIAEEESSFNQFAISDKNAIGIMQIMPFWVDELEFLSSKGDLFTPELNIRAGARIFKHYLTRCGTLSAALRCYHGGERAITAPFIETLIYAEGVQRTYNRNLTM